MVSRLYKCVRPWWDEANIVHAHIQTREISEGEEAQQGLIKEGGSAHDSAKRRFSADFDNLAVKKIGSFVLGILYPLRMVFGFGPSAFDQDSSKDESNFDLHNDRAFDDENEKLLVCIVPFAHIVCYHLMHHSCSRHWQVIPVFPRISFS